MDDTTYIQKVLNDDGDAENQPLNGETGEKQSSADILKQMNFIGTKITEVSTNLQDDTPDAIFPIK